jgi:hypothetical protein
MPISGTKRTGEMQRVLKIEISENLREEAADGLTDKRANLYLYDSDR